MSSKKHSARYSAPLKGLMLVLYLLSIFTVIAAVLGTWYMAEDGIYSESLSEVQEKRIERRCRMDIVDAENIRSILEAEGYFEEATPESRREQIYREYMEPYAPERSNFWFEICDADNTLLLSSGEGEARYSHMEYISIPVNHEEEQRLSPEEWETFLESHDMETVNYSLQEVWVLREGQEVPDDQPVEVYDIGVVFAEPALSSMEYSDDGTQMTDTVHHAVYDLYYDLNASYTEETPGYYVTGYVRKDMQAEDGYSRDLHIASLCHRWRYAVPAAGGCALLVCIITVIFLAGSAGYHKGSETVQPSVFERIPYDLFIGLLLVPAGACVPAVSELAYMDFPVYAVILCGCVGLWSLLVLWWIMSTAVRIRTGQIFRHTLCAMLLRRLGGCVRTAAAHTPVFWQAGLAALGFVLVNALAVVLILHGEIMGVLLLVMLYLALIGTVCAVAVQLHILEKAGERLAQGTLSEPIPEGQLIGRFRLHARHLGQIREGMDKAVQERLRSERFKTELIANVSHDIRTPLTSIINYTDLLSKLGIEDPQAQEYIGIITRQSDRLRKLTEDVLEASKAATGNVQANLQRMDLRVLLEQIEGEYAERFEARQLTAVCSMPDAPLPVMADGRLLWRVMDNLFGNICKYAMSGTRVYVDAAAGADGTALTVRNISAAPLHISPDALLERFVQGDRSRNTEGSGLGLSIAQSLMEVQGGRLSLSVDGDLFKVELHFPPAAET